jgi:hypothetical protein
MNTHFCEPEHRMIEGYKDLVALRDAEILRLRIALKPLAHCHNKVTTIVSVQIGETERRDCGYCGGCKASAALENV